MSSIALKVYERNIKSNIKKLRKAGEIPGIIYGEFLDDPIPVKMPDLNLKKIIHENNSGSIIEVILNDKKFNCVVKEIQKNNLKEILHVDLQYTKPNEIIKMRIPVNYIGQENLEFKKLLLETHNLFLDLQGSVEDIPEYIEINISEMNFKDKIFAEDISIPKNVTLLTDPKTLLAVVNS